MIDTAGESHLAVILARGKSSRMGRPKGLVRLEKDGPTFLELTDGLYRSRGWARLIVTLADLRGPYAEVMTKDAGLTWLEAEPGLGTARTVQLAWKWCHHRNKRPGTLWLHPVDLPLVQTATLDALEKEIQKAYPCPLRPVFEDIPGHPVVAPMSFLDRVFCPSSEATAGPFGSLLAEHDLRSFSVKDRGVVLDFDNPEDLSHWQGGTGRASK